MKQFCFIALASLSLLTACDRTSLSQNNNILNPQLLNSYANYDSSLEKKRSELAFSNGQTANNCSSYYQLAPHHGINEATHNQAVKSEYLICDALKLLSSKNISPITTPPELGEVLSSKLDLRSYPSSLFRISSDTQYTLKALYPTGITSKGATTTIETDDWIYRLEVAAVAQLNNNKTLDWVIWLSDESKSGNYRAYATLVLYDPDNQASYTATSYPQ